MAKKAQALVDGKPLDDELIKNAVAAAREEIKSFADITNSAQTKQHLIGVLLERGLKHLIT
jgi:carbon-monoxide dehydrogenase medium subunit